MDHLRDWWCPLCLATSVHYVVKPHTLGSTTILSLGTFQHAIRPSVCMATEPIPEHGDFRERCEETVTMGTERICRLASPAAVRGDLDPSLAPRWLSNDCKRGIAHPAPNIHRVRCASQ